MNNNHIVMFSGGAASFVAGLRVEAKHDDVTWLFTDTKIEDPDLYRFLDEVGKNRNLVEIEEGRDPWQVFFDERFLGNTRADPCSKILKRRLARKWVETNCDPEKTTVYVGISWEEEHRLETIHKNWAPWKVEAPLCDPPFLFRDDIFQEVFRARLDLPDLYGLGFQHNNCGGFCVKAGQAQFALLLKHRRDLYLYHERREQELREYLGKDIAILRDRRGKKTRPMTMKTFRERVERGESYDLFEWGGCGCFV